MSRRKEYIIIIAVNLTNAHNSNENKKSPATEEEKHKQLTARRKRMEAESVSIGDMLTELEELEAPPIEFDEKLWSIELPSTTMIAWCVR